MIHGYSRQRLPCVDLATVVATRKNVTTCISLAPAVASIDWPTDIETTLEKEEVPK
jgi:hypothetical protein